MPSVLDLPVAKKKPAPTTEPEQPPKLSRRFELLFDPAWYERIEAQARRIGMKPAVYIRLAVTEKVLRDESAGIGGMLDKAEEYRRK
jgi:hypothetical protein